MRILVDESLSPVLADQLMADGHDCLHVNRLGLRGKSDDIIFQTAVERDAILISLDLGFADITRYALGSHPGIIAIRIPGEIRIAVLITEVVVRLRTLTESDIKGNVVIIEPDRTRIRRKSP